MQYSNYADTDSRDAVPHQPVDASTPALPQAAFAGAYRPAAPPPLDLSSAQPVATAAGAYRPTTPRPAPVQPASAAPAAAPIAEAAPVERAQKWFRGKHVVAGAVIAVALAGGGLFAVNTAHHKTTADAAKAAETTTDPATTRSVDDNFQRLGAGLSSVDAAMAEQPGDLAE